MEVVKKQVVQGMICLHILIQSNTLLKRSDMVGIIQDGKFWFYVSDIAIVISEKKTTSANGISCLLIQINKTSNIQLKCIDPDHSLFFFPPTIFCRCILSCFFVVE